MSLVAPVVVPCKTVDELWAKLDPLQPMSAIAATPNDLVFRGQGDSAWDLVPSVYRRRGARRWSPAQLVFKRDALSADQHAVAELRLLQLFVEACDRSALALPLDGAVFRMNWVRVNSPGLGKIGRYPETWPPEELFDLLALAQHHRIPTRLLDWTRRSHVAAYFAAADAIHREDAGSPPNELAVWVLDIERRSLFREMEVVRVPGATSQNLAAQEGLFTLVRGRARRGEPEDAPRLEDLLEGAFAHNPGACPLWKLTLPRSDARALLDRCARFGVSAATLFPGYDGAAMSVVDKLFA